VKSKERRSKNELTKDYELRDKIETFSAMKTVLKPKSGHGTVNASVDSLNGIGLRLLF